jgi:hypothetical protein
MHRLKQRFVDNRILVWVAAPVIIAGAGLLGLFVSRRWLVLIVLGIGAAILLQHPRLGLIVIVPTALLVRFQIPTGTEVVLNFSTILIPALSALWLLDGIRRGSLRITQSRVNRPLLFFLFGGLVSLFVGNVLWDPAVPRSGSFLLVQLAQWSIFAFSAFAFWLTANLVDNEVWLRRLTFGFVGVAAVIAVIWVVLWRESILRQLVTFAVDRAPFWMLLVSVAGAQLLFNHDLDRVWRAVTAAAVISALAYAFILQRDTASNWVGVGAAVGALVWLRWPRLRWVAVFTLAVLLVSGLLFSAIYDFAGGEAEWVESGGSRLALIERVAEVTMRNPITGLGPAAYRPYARMEPLPYRGAFWVSPNVSSHNNYVDLFSHVGLLGLGLFMWFAIEVTLLGFRLRTRYTESFAAGYVNGLIAAWAGSLVLMLFADWILPFVYNIGFPGFQASVLIWLFLGGLVALENISEFQTV